MAGRTRRPGRVVAAAGVLLGAIAAASPAGAQTTAPVSLTLDEAVRMGLEHAPRMAEARSKEAAASSSVTALKALGLPSVTLSAQYLRMNHVEELSIPDGMGGSRVIFPDIPNAYKTRAEVTAPIYSFGRIASNVAAAESQMHAADAERRVVEADVQLDVMQAYWTLATVRETVNVLTESLARADAWVRDVQVRAETGFLPPNDVLSAQAQRARQRVRLLQAQNDASLAELNLARLIGVALGTPIRTASAVDQPLPGAVTLAALSPDELIARALAGRGERAALTATGEGLRESAKATLANLNPYAIGLASIEPSRPNQRFLPPKDAWRTSWTLDVKLVWPLFDSGRTRAQAAVLNAQAGAVDAKRDELDGLVSLEVRQRLLEVEFGRAAIGASDEAVNAAREARRVLDERFDAGVATSTEVLDAQVALLEAELERTRLNAGLRLSEARLLRAVGGR